MSDGSVFVFFPPPNCVTFPVQFAAGMAAASQTIIVKTALSYQDIYEVDDTLHRVFIFTNPI